MKANPLEMRTARPRTARPRRGLATRSTNKENNGVSTPRALNGKEKNYLSPTVASKNKERRKRFACHSTTTPQSASAKLAPALKRGPSANRNNSSNASDINRVLQFPSATQAVVPQTGELIAKAIFKLFEDSSAQRKWISLSTVVSICHRLSNFHPTTPLVDGSYGTKFTFETALDGLLHEQFATKVALNVFSDRSKLLYMRVYHFAGAKEAAVYFEPSNQTPWMPPLGTTDPTLWIQNLKKQTLSLKPFMPPKLYTLCNWWYSTEAEQLFAAREGESAEEAARTLYEMLSKASKSTENAKEIIVGLGKNAAPTYYIDNFDGEPLEMEFDAVRVEKLAQTVKTRSSYLARAIKLMLQADPENQSLSWGSKCKEAMDQIRLATGDDSFTNPKTIQAWLRQFRTTRAFKNPLMVERIGIALFTNYPEAAKQIRRHANEHLVELSLNFVQQYITGELTPKLAAQEKEDVDTFLHRNGLRRVCFNTVHRWLLFLGFKRDLYKKGFYNDVHEREDVVKARIEYCIQMMKFEIRCAVWVQLLPDRVQQLKQDERIFPTNDGYPVSKGGQQHYEFHVDDITDSHSLPELQGCHFGGRHSLRMPPNEKPVMVWGQDEVVSHEKALNSMAWYGSEGQQVLRPKDLGASIMISGVISRKVGWSAMPTTQQLALINEKRSGEEYVARDSAIAVFGSARKQPLTEEDIKHSCFRWSIHPGANNEGHWTNNHTLVQLENIADIANVLYPDHQHVICYDHSQGHTAKRKDGLDASRLNKDYGGQQATMHDSVLTEKCLGQFANDGLRLNAGDVQSFVFKEDDEGPSWLSPDQQQATKYDRVFEGELVKRTLRSKKEIHRHLLSKLGAEARLPADVSHTSLASLRDVARRHNVSLSVEEAKRKKGWVNAPKGALQLCIERGLVDLEKVKENRNYCTMDDRKGPNNSNPSPTAHTSLRKLLEECEDFKQEISMLEWVAKQYGWLVIFYPKCHPEIAGVGIEYVWSVAKNRLVRIPLKERKGKDLFTAVLLGMCFDKQTLTINTVRGCARKARQFTMAYLMLHAMDAAKQEGASGDSLLNGEVSLNDLRNKGTELKFSTIRAAKKMHKRHRGTALFDHENSKVQFSNLESVDDFVKKEQRKRKKK